MSRLKFQFSLPAWGATYFQFIAHYCHHISILAPCLGSDKSAMLHRRSFVVFNSRSPHGERLNQYVLVKLHFIFQFTLPTWGAAKDIPLCQTTAEFSIHAPRMESDHLLWVHFTVRTVSIHAPRMGSDIICSFSIMSPCIFNSRSPYGERHLRTPLSGGRLLFQFSFPVWGATLRQSSL